jgi:hypothetical protein
MKSAILLLATFSLCFIPLTPVGSLHLKSQTSSAQVPTQSKESNDRPAIKPISVLTAQEAYRILKEVNQKKGLMFIPPFEPRAYSKLRPENCFGLALPNSAHLVGESAGREYGVINYGKADKAYTMIGILYSESEFLIKGQPLAKDTPYNLYVASDELRIDYVSRESFTGGYLLPLGSRIDDSLLIPDSGKGKNKRPRFNLTKEGDNAYIIINGSKYPITIK